MTNGNWVTIHGNHVFIDDSKDGTSAGVVASTDKGGIEENPTPKNNGGCFGSDRSKDVYTTHQMVVRESF